MQIRIEGTQLPGRDCGSGDNFPGYANIHVGVQSKSPRDELVGVHRGDAASAAWTLDCSVDGDDIRGPQIHGRPGDRFIYLSWGTVDDAGHFAMFRRAKLMLAAVPAEVMTGALASGTLVGALGLTDTKGQPLCARVVPPNIHWSSR
ncbi:DUF5990 family protein [Candidatus Mycobacterium wuenschmannii]|uniref:DUF5990 family protein n=1 Tax=Candidatus Mycobacterium wuenschmannii TaxID=3027808 RepID=A0ABY8VTD9_9MYCO|nr:DUF5990 family protein [Candidatus Mycobacterium wuenschmannii]WIM86762.1 DUF5990 family protein [Candidatus Mycobacterium wuenschmannii]